jgi:uncharacterized protein
MSALTVLRSILGVLAAAIGAVSCAGPSLTLTPAPPPPAACPIGGCGPRASVAGPVLASAECPSAAAAPCGGASPVECTRRALSIWSEARDDRAVSCVARMLAEACQLGDARGCAFAGRMWVDGRAVERDVVRGIAMLVRACDGGVALSCVVGVRWLGEPAHARDMPDAVDLRARLEAEHACLTGEAGTCYQVGLLFYFGRSAFPQDRAQAVQAYGRGCDLGDSRACNNLGDALAHGDGVERDAVRSVAMFDRACRLGEALGCSNSGQMFERGEGVVRDRVRARTLYRAACASGDIYGCLHAEMLATQDAGAPRDPARAFAFFRRACERRDARACAFVGVIYDDGPEGGSRDTDKSLEAMNRACMLGEGRACEWIKEHR